MVILEPGMVHWYIFDAHCKGKQMQTPQYGYLSSDGLSERKNMNA